MIRTKWDVRELRGKVQSNYNVMFVVNNVGNLETFLVTEGNGGIRPCIYLSSEGKGVSPDGHGYVFRNGNSQEVHQVEGIYRSFNLGLTTRENDARAGARICLDKLKLMKNVQEFSIETEFDQSNELLSKRIGYKDVFIRLECHYLFKLKSRTLSNLMLGSGINHINMIRSKNLFYCGSLEAGLFKTCYRKFVKIMVFKWLINDLLIAVAMVLEGSGSFSKGYFVKRTRRVSGSIVGNFSSCGGSKYWKGVNYVTITPIKKWYLYSLCTYCNLPTIGLPMTVNSGS
jgi:hypothetical protein